MRYKLRLPMTKEAERVWRNECRKADKEIDRELRETPVDQKWKAGKKYGHS